MTPPRPGAAPVDAVLDAVLTDLAAETAGLDDLVAPLAATQWRTPTPAVGWTLAHQVAHLAWTDEAALAAATDPARWEELLAGAAEDPTGFVDRTAEEGARMPPAELLGWWREVRARLWDALAAHPPGARIPWFGPPMSPTSMATARFMETWAHALDVAEGLADAGLADVPAPTDRVRHVAHLGARTRDFAFTNAGLEPPTEAFRVELTLPSGETWTQGPEDAAQAVRGSAYDFALRVTQRRHLDDLDLRATGPDARRWLEVAQAFAGPPGGGRDPKGGRR